MVLFTVRPIIIVSIDMEMKHYYQILITKKMRS
jgi:hypothetical protein